jgi:hypothetical protein
VLYNAPEVINLNKLSKLIEQEIKKQYRSVRQFSASMGIPNSTVVSAVKNGVSGTGYDTVIKICKKLSIDISNPDFPVLLTDRGKNLLIKYNALDEKGQHTIDTVLELEYYRCTFTDDSSYAAAFGKTAKKNAVDYSTKDRIEAAANDAAKRR